MATKSHCTTGTTRPWLPLLTLDWCKYLGAWPPTSTPWFGNKTRLSWVPSSPPFEAATRPHAIRGEVLGFFPLSAVATQSKLEVAASAAYRD